MSNHIRFEVHNKQNFTDEERIKFMASLDLAKQVLNSAEFKERFLALPLVQTLGYSNIDIYNMLMSGADKFNTEADSAIDVHITMYYSFRNTVGYTYPTTWWTWINRKFFSYFSYADVAGNVVHEYMHNMSFDHRRASDSMSVPYATGDLVSAMINELINKAEDILIDATQNNAIYKKSIWTRINNFFKNIF